jgi:arylformamidase
MRIFDISVPISEEIPVWPGDPRVTLRQLSSIKAGDHANVSQIRMSVHTGTHIDAPKHFIDSGNTIDQIPLEKLTGGVLVMDLGTEITHISKDVLMTHPQIEQLMKASKVLFKTRNSSLWKTHPRTFQEDYVGIDSSGADFLSTMDLHLVGVDYLSIAPFNETLEPHQTLLGKDIVLLEGIDLSEVSGGIYKLYCLPLNIKGCEGSPARVILTSND